MPRADIRSAVIIATHRRIALLRRTLTSLSRPENRSDLERSEVLVVENGGRFGAEEVCAEFGSLLPLHHIFVAEAGKSNALNVAVERVGADLLVFFDDDVAVGSGTPRAFQDAASRHGPGHFFGGPLEVEYEAPPPDWLVRWLPPSARGWTLGDEESFHDAPDFLGGNWAAFRHDILEAGGFRRDLGPDASRFRTIASETELQERLLAGGCRGVFVPGARSRHWVPAERCSIRWARDRRFRGALTEVLREEPEADRHPRIARVPRFLWRQCAQDGVRALLARIFLPRGPRRMEWEMRAAHSWGRAAGYRAAADLAESRERGEPSMTGEIEGRRKTHVEGT